MAAMRKTRGAGAVGAAIVVLSLLAAAAFVAPPRARNGALRGSNAGHELDVAPFQPYTPQPVDEQPRAMGWASFASLVAALGLVAGVASTPVRAEEAPAAAPAETPAAAPAEAPAAAPAETPAAAPAAASVEPPAPEITTFESGGAFAKGGRAKAKRGVKNAAATKKSSSTSSSGSSSGAVMVSTEEGKKKIIISPADERDEDELTLSRTNRPLLALLAVLPSSIFIVFWTLGSLEII